MSFLLPPVSQQLTNSPSFRGKPTSFFKQLRTWTVINSSNVYLIPILMDKIEFQRFYDKFEIVQSTIWELSRIIKLPIEYRIFSLWIHVKLNGISILLADDFFKNNEGATFYCSVAELCRRLIEMQTNRDLQSFLYLVGMKALKMAKSQQRTSLLRQILCKKAALFWVGFSYKIETYNRKLTRDEFEKLPAVFKGVTKVIIDSNSPFFSSNCILPKRVDSQKKQCRDLGSILGEALRLQIHSNNYNVFVFLNRYADVFCQNSMFWETYLQFLRGASRAEIASFRNILRYVEKLKPDRQHLSARLLCEMGCFELNPITSGMKPDNETSFSWERFDRAKYLFSLASIQDPAYGDSYLEHLRALHWQSYAKMQSLLKEFGMNQLEWEAIKDLVENENWALAISDTLLQESNHSLAPFIKLREFSDLLQKIKKLKEDFYSERNLLRFAFLQSYSTHGPMFSYASSLSYCLSPLFPHEIWDYAETSIVLRMQNEKFYFNQPQIGIYTFIDEVTAFEWHQNLLGIRIGNMNSKTNFADAFFHFFPSASPVSACMRIKSHFGCS